MKALAKLALYEKDYRKYKERLLDIAAFKKFGTTPPAGPDAPVPPVVAHYQIKTLAEVFMAEKIRENVDKEFGELRIKMD